MVLKVNTDPSCPGYGCMPDDASLTNVTLNHDATRKNHKLRFSMSSIPADRWEEIFGSRDNADRR
jgi:hypothetical protein